MNKAKEISVLWSQIKPQIGELVRLCHEVESHYEVTADAYQRGYETAKHECEDCPKQAYTDALKMETYQKGLSDAWDAAKKVVALSTVDRRKVFGSEYMYSILEKHTASEAIEKLKAYEQEQNEIQVGDEVVGTYTGEEETEPFVIIRKIPEIYPTYYFGIYSKSGEFCQGGLKLKKTGRHFPEIAEVLQKMKETNNG